MSYDPNQFKTKQEVDSATKLSDTIKIAEKNLSGITSSFDGLLDQQVSSDIKESLTFILSSSSGGSSFFEKIFEKGLGNFFDTYKDLGGILNAYRSSYIPHEIAKNIKSSINDFSTGAIDFATFQNKDYSKEDIQKISAKKFLKESYENCFMRLMGLPASDSIRSSVAYMDFATGKVVTFAGMDELDVRLKTLSILDQRQGIVARSVKTLGNTFYDVSKISINDVDPFANLEAGEVQVLKDAKNGALQLMQSESVEFQKASSDDVYSYYIRALSIISNSNSDQVDPFDPLNNTVPNPGTALSGIGESYIDGKKGKGALRQIFNFLFYNKIQGLPILNVADELKGYSHLMFPTVQDSRIHKCIAERGKYISPPFEHQTGFRINNETPVMSFLEGIIRIRLDKISGYNPDQVIAIAKNSSESNLYSIENVDGAYSILESIMINRLVATLKICSKRLSKSCTEYAKNAIKANITITERANKAKDLTANSSNNDSAPENLAATKPVGKSNSEAYVQEQSLNILKGIEDSMLLLLGDTSKGLDIQLGTLRKSTITETPLMNILVSSITVPSKYIEKERRRQEKKANRVREDVLEKKKREISTIIGIGRGVGLLDALVFILAMLTVKESVLLSMLTPRQFDNLKKEFGDSKFFDSFEISGNRTSIESAIMEYTFQVNAAYDLFISFIKNSN